MSLGQAILGRCFFLICCKNSEEFLSRHIPSINIYNVMLLKRMCSTQPCPERTLLRCSLLFLSCSQSPGTLSPPIVPQNMSQEGFDVGWGQELLLTTLAKSNGQLFLNTSDEIIIFLLSFFLGKNLFVVEASPLYFEFGAVEAYIIFKRYQDSSESDRH